MLDVMDPGCDEDVGLFERLLDGAAATSARSVAILAGIERVSSPGGVAGIRFVEGSAGRSASLDVPSEWAAFVESLGLKGRTPPGRPVMSYEADTEALAYAASLVRKGAVSSAPCLTFPSRPGLGAVGTSERRAAFLGRPAAVAAVCRALGLVAGTSGLPVLPRGPLRLSLLTFAEPAAVSAMVPDYGSSTMFGHARTSVVAPPFLMHVVSQRRFVLVDAADDSLAPVLPDAGFRRHPEGYWVSTSPSAAHAFRRFADPFFRELLDSIYARWPFIDDGFKLEDLEKVAGIATPSAGRRKEREDAVEPRLHFDAGTGLFFTRDAALAASSGLDLLDARDLTAIALSEGVERRALFGSAFLPVVAPLRHEADDGAELEILCRMVEDAAGPALPSSWRPPEPSPGFAYDEDQVDGIRHGMRGRVVSIADDMGIGKSFEAAGLIDAVRRDHATRSPMVLYVLPASQRDAITAVIASVPGGPPFTVRRLDGCGIDPVPSNVVVVDAASAVVPRDGGVVVVVSYETLVTATPLLGVEWDAVVFDESHMIKNVDAGRTAAVIDPVGDGGIRALRVVFMSGTQITNTMSDYWPMLRLLLRSRMTTRSRFKGLFSARPGPLGDEDPVKIARIARLARALDSGIRIRRTKEELGKTPGKLPPIIVNVPVADPSAVTAAGREVDLMDSLEGMRDARAIVEVKREINAIRKGTAMAKIPFLVPELCGIAAREPLVVFAHHVEVAEALGDAMALAGARVAVLTGRRTSPAQRFALINAFQEGGYDAVVATMSCAGVGYTMTRSAYCAIVELDWKAHIVAQAPDRLDRRGQTRKVQVAFYVVRRSFDSVVARGIVTKSRIADVANGDDARRLAGALQRASAAHRGVDAFANSFPA